MVFSEKHQNNIDVELKYLVVRIATSLLSHLEEGLVPACEQEHMMLRIFLQKATTRSRQSDYVRHETERRQQDKSTSRQLRRQHPLTPKEKGKQYC